MSENKKLSLRATKAPDGRAHIVAAINDRELFVDVCDLYSQVDRERVASGIHRVCPAAKPEAVERLLQNIDPASLPDSSPSPSDPWDEPQEIERPRGDGFPANVLPYPLGDWVVATAEAYQVPSDLPGLLALAVGSGMVARRVAIEAGRGWLEPVNLYVCCLLDPGNRKSAVFRSALEPVRTIEAELIETKGPEVARLQSIRRVREKELANLERKAASGGKGAEDSRQRAIDLAEELQREPMPMMPKLCVDDATSESIEKALASQSGRLIVAGAEGGLFDVLQGRYSNGAISLDIFLKGHAGDDLRVDRVSRGSVVVDRPALTMAYAIQPQVIEGLAENPAFRGRGLIGRFVYAYPQSILGSRNVNPEPLPTPLAESYDRLMRRLYEWAEQFAHESSPRRLRLSDEAAEVFLRWQNEVEPMLGPSGCLSSMADWGGKLCGLTARFAAVLHLVRYIDGSDPSVVPVDVETIQGAICLGRWAVPHARATYSLLGGPEVDPGAEDAAYILGWLREQRKAEVTRREIGQRGRARFDGKPERLTTALAVLVDTGWLRSMEGDKGPGRPSERYLCHPKIANDAALEESGVDEVDEGMI